MCALNRLLRPGAGVKSLLRRTVFRDGAVRRITLGPLAGMRWRVGELTGLAPFYSGGESDVQEALSAHMPAGGVAVDAGANWGLHTLLLSRLAGPSGRVLAVEPFPPNVVHLSDHVAINRAANVTVVTAALADRPGSVPYLPGENGSVGKLVFGGETPAGCIPVPVRTLDEVAAAEGLSRLDVAKVDVEGAESRLLEGARAVMERFRPVLVVELHTPEQDLACGRILTDAGYSLTRCGGGPPIVRIDRSWPDPEGVWGTVICTPRR